MTANELRTKFLEFFESKGHKVIPSSSLVPENDPSVLFTTAGMQQFKRFYLFPDEAPASRVTTCQKCVRTGDIEEVGDETHLTFFEMLGNFSFGYPSKEDSYFKREAIEWAWEFLTEELKIEKSRLSATYFAGDQGIPEDSESKELLKEITGLEDSKILGTGFSETFWSLGTEGSPGGPTVELYIDGIEIWNLVFNQYVMRDRKYELVDLKGVDTGMGLERLLAVLNGAENVYHTDLFELPHKKLHELLKVENPVDERIVLDHIKTAVFMINDGAIPSNKGQGYILRRLIRRAIVKARNLKIEQNFCSELFDPVCHSGLDPESRKSLEENSEIIMSVLEKEESSFRKTLDLAFRELTVLSQTKKGPEGEESDQKYELSGNNLFDLFQTNGLPLEVTLEEAEKMGIPIQENAKNVFQMLLSAHQQKSRTASAGMFKGGLADNKVETTRLHTAAHLLLAALRIVLGNHVTQKGSNITEERLRFDFSHPEKLTDEQIAEVEKIVNEKIAENLPVTMEEMTVDEAKNSGAMGVFDDRYGDKVKVYTIGPDQQARDGERSRTTRSGPPFSREICGGPHVSNTGDLGHFKITKEESSSAGIRRIKAILENKE